MNFFSNFQGAVFEIFVEVLRFVLNGILIKNNTTK